MLLVSIAVLVGLIAAVVAVALPHASWASRVKAGAAAFAVTLPTVLVTMTAAGLL
jgi:hypothetical protein